MEYKNITKDFIELHQEDIEKSHLYKLFEAIEDSRQEHQLIVDIIPLLNKMEKQGKYEPDYWVGVYYLYGATILYVNVNDNDNGWFENATHFMTRDEAETFMQDFAFKHEYDIKWWVVGLKD